MTMRLENAHPTSLSAGFVVSDSMPSESEEHSPISVKANERYGSPAGLRYQFEDAFKKTKALLWIVRGRSW